MGYFKRDGSKTRVNAATIQHDETARWQCNERTTRGDATTSRRGKKRGGRRRWRRRWWRWQRWQRWKTIIGKSSRQREHRLSHDGMRCRNWTADNNATTNQRTAVRRQWQRRWRQCDKVRMVKAWRWRGGDGSAVAAARWQQRGGCGGGDSATARRRWQRGGGAAAVALQIL